MKKSIPEINTCVLQQFHDVAIASLMTLMFEAEREHRMKG